MPLGKQVKLFHMKLSKKTQTFENIQSKILADRGCEGHGEL